MKTSESIKNLTKALLKAQTQMGAAVKGSKNPFFKSNYADLPTVMEVVKAPLNEVGVLVLQPATYHDGRNFIQTTLIHAETGEYITSETEVVFAKAGDPQAFGAAQTYARRFGLQALLFIPSEDDDGNFASGKTNTYTKASKAAELPVTVTTGYNSVTLTTQGTTVTNETNATTAETNPTTTPTVAPLRKSSFRNQRASAAPMPAPTSTTAGDNGEGW